MVSGAKGRAFVTRARAEPFFIQSVWIALPETLQFCPGIGAATVGFEVFDQRRRHGPMKFVISYGAMCQELSGDLLTERIVDVEQRWGHTGARVVSDRRRDSFAREFGQRPLCVGSGAIGLLARSGKLGRNTQGVDAIAGRPICDHVVQQREANGRVRLGAVAIDTFFLVIDVESNRAEVVLDLDQIRVTSRHADGFEQLERPADTQPRPR